MSESVVTEANQEIIEDLSTEPSVAENAAASLSSLKDSLAKSSRDLSGIFKTAREGITEVHNVAQRLVSLGGGAAVAGKSVIAGLEKCAIILDVEKIIPVFRESYGTASVAINTLIAHNEKLNEEVEDAVATCEMIRDELVASKHKYNQLLIIRPVSALYKHIEGASDSFNVLNSVDSVQSRLKFIIDGGDVTGVAVVINQSTGENSVQAFYFSDYFASCDKILGFKLNLSNETPDGGFVYRAVMNIAVATADSITTAFGHLGATLDKHHSDDAHGLKFESDDLVKAEVSESVPPDIHMDAGVTQEVEDLLAGSADASVDDDGDIMSDAAPEDLIPDAPEESAVATEQVDILVDEAGFAQG